VDVEVRSAVPKDFVMDGAIAEWGDVCAPVTGAAPTGKRTRQAAATCATIALLSDRVVIAGKLGAMGSEGMWLGLTMPMPGEFPKPKIESGGVAEDVACAKGGEGKTKQICQRFTKLYTAAMESTARFYVIRPSGVVLHESSAGLPKREGKPVKGAKVTAGGGGTFELEMPLAALPRTGASPIVELYVTPGVGELPKIMRRWSKRPLPAGVELDPLGRERSKLLGEITSGGQAVSLYQPGTDEIEVFAVAGEGATREVSAKKRRLTADGR
jgi:hypothetical protein